MAASASDQNGTHFTVKAIVAPELSHASTARRGFNTGWLETYGHDIRMVASKVTIAADTFPQASRCSHLENSSECKEGKCYMIEYEAGSRRSARGAASREWTGGRKGGKIQDDRMRKDSWWMYCVEGHLN